MSNVGFGICVRAIAVSMLFSGIASAQQADCGCLLPVSGVPATGIVGKLTRVSGEVILATVTGPQVAAQGAGIHVGDLLMVGPRSSATFDGGGCSSDVGAGKELRTSVTEKKICVAIDDAGSLSLFDRHAALPVGGASVAAAGTSSAGGVAPAGGVAAVSTGVTMGIAAAVTAVVVTTIVVKVATSDKKNPVSPVE